MTIARGARRLFWPLVGLTLLLLAIQPLLAGHLPWRGDGSLHFYRLLEVERAAAYGELLPAWAPDLGFGYGFPLFRYYAPLSYLLLLPWRWLGFSTTGAFLAGYALALLLVGLGLGGWSRAVAGRGDKALALVAPVAAVYAPYLLFNVYQRGAYAEVWGLAWLSLGLWAVRRAARGGGPLASTAVALVAAGLAFSHNISALLGLPLLAGYALLEATGAAPTGRPAARVGRALVPLLLGLGLAAAFWLPAVVERDAIRLDRLVDGANFDYRAHFLVWRDLLALPRTADPARVNPPWPMSLGWPQLLAAALAWWPGRPATRHALPRSWRRTRLGFTIAFALLLLFMLPVSAPLWAAIPLLPLIQFPWRLLGPASLCLAALAGLGALRLGRRVVAPLILLLLIGALPWLFPPGDPAPSDPSPADLIRFEAETGFLGTTSAADFLPRDVAELPPPDALLAAYEAAGPAGLIPRLDPASLPATASLVADREGWNESEVTVESAVAFTARLRRFAFPGWALTIDGAPLAWRPSVPEGLIEADVPAGRHTLRLAFVPTRAVRLGQGISLASLAALVAIVGLGLARRRGARERNAAPAQTGGAALGAALLALGLLLPLLKSAWLDRADTPFRRVRLAGDVVRGVGEPIRANFGDDLELLAAALPEEPVPADRKVEVTLAWRALPPVAGELSVSLQLEDDQGQRIAQSDHQHPADLPVTRWLAGEYALDQHGLQPAAATPPGAYTLWLQVYRTATGELVSRRDASGRPLGPRMALGTVRLARPNAPPTLLELPMDWGFNEEMGDGVYLYGRGSLPDRVGVGEPLAVTLFWGAEEAPSRTAAVRLQLVDGADQPVAERIHVPPGSALPPTAWLPGDVWRDAVVWRVPLLAAGPGADGAPGPLLAGRYALRLALVDAGGGVVGREVELGEVEVTVPARSFARPEPQRALDVNFGGVAALRGFDLAAANVAAGETLALTLYWESLAVTETSYTVFAQVLRDGQIVAQHDSPPLGGERPTTGWLPGEVLVDRVDLRLPDGAEPGEYALLVGMYDPAGGERLTAGDGADAFTLPAEVEIRPAAGGP